MGQIFRVICTDGLHAPAGKYLVRIMAMVMAAGTDAILVIMMHMAVVMAVVMVMVVVMAMLVVMVMTAAGATYPYGIDPEDSNLRIAPSYPPVEELKEAMSVFCTCVKLAAAEKLLAEK